VCQKGKGSRSSIGPYPNPRPILAGREVPLTWGHPVSGLPAVTAFPSPSLDDDSATSRLQAPGWSPDDTTRRRPIPPLANPTATPDTGPSLRCRSRARSQAAARPQLDIPGAEAVEGVRAEVVRRQPDGTWKYAIDNPWGGAVLGAAG